MLIHYSVRALAIVVLCGMTFANVAAQTPLEISPRVGSEIDSVEREYFGLFPLLPAVSRVQLFPAGDTGYTAQVEFWMDAERKDTSYALTPVEKAGLSALVDHYENLGSRQQTTYDYVRTHLANPRLTPNVESEMEVVRFSGDPLRVRPMSVVESGMYVLTDSTRFDWTNPDATTDFVHADDIWRVRDPSYGTKIKVSSIVGMAAGLVGAINYVREEERPISALGIVIGGGSIGGMVGNVITYNRLIGDEPTGFDFRRDDLAESSMLGARLPAEVDRTVEQREADRLASKRESSDLNMFETWEPLRFVARMSYHEVGIQDGSVEVSGRYGPNPKTYDMEALTRHAIQIDVRARLLGGLHASVGLPIPVTDFERELEALLVEEGPFAALEYDLIGLGRNMTGGKLDLLIRPSLTVRMADVRYDLAANEVPGRNLEYEESGHVLGVHCDVLARYWINDLIMVFSSIGPGYYRPSMTIDSFGFEYSRQPPHDLIEREFEFEPYVQLDVRIGAALTL